MQGLLTVNSIGRGTLALVGSGEYLPAMEPVDRFLLSHLAEPADVICLPTAAGTEGPERVAYWSNLGIAHFQRLGVPVEALPLIDRAGAEKPAFADRIRRASFIYLSGGKPIYLYETLKDSPAWQAIVDVLERGGVVAGCSAGAMIFGARIPTSLFSTRWQAAFGYLAGVFIIPHFNELPGLVMSNLPLLVGNQTMLGIEGNTALVCTSQGFFVQGSGTVTVARGRQKQKFSQGKIEPASPQSR